MRDPRLSPQAKWTRMVAVAAAVMLTAPGIAVAQSSILLPTLLVTASRLGLGVVGTSVSVIDAEEIARAPEQTLHDILGRQPGIQVRDLYGGVAGARSVIDMRGFGAAATSNALILVNGRRLNDIDIAGVDLSAIPRSSIARIEIIRGNSGAVLYGDGAVGGVINIVTKTGVGLPPSFTLDGRVGSFQYAELGVAAANTFGPLTVSAYGSGIESDGYRENNALWQRSAVGEIRYATDTGGVYLNISGDTQRVGLPGVRRVTLTSSQVATDPRGADTPFDYANTRGLNVTAGATRMLWDGFELIVDGGVRHKAQRAAFFSNFGMLFDSYVDTTLTTTSLTPRVKMRSELFGLPADTIAGFDIYHSDYDSDRLLHQGDAPYHRYALEQTTIAGYAQTTVALGAKTDVSLGARLQRNALIARDTFDPAAPGAFFSSQPQEGMPLDWSETQHALHAGIEHRIDDTFTVFARGARSFRLPNVDERVGMAPFGVPTSFDLKTQTSHDIEAGVRVHHGPFDLQASAYLMELKNELHFNPITFVNVNLDPTQRRGVEVAASIVVSDRLRFNGGVTYTEAKFRAGPFAGKDVPLVSRWTGNVGVSWDIVPTWLVLDAQAHFVGPRRMDNDQMNFQPLIPAQTLIDVRIGGQAERLQWSFTVENLLDQRTFNYAIASTATFGTYNAYPLPGRTFMVRAALTTD